MLSLVAGVISWQVLAVVWPTVGVAVGGIAAVAFLFIAPSLILRKYIRIMINILDDHAAWPSADGRELSSLDGEEVSFRAADGHRLDGTIVRGAHDGRAAGMVVFAHEYCSDRTSCMRFCRGLLAEGYDVFAFDFRGHGTSRCDRGYRPRQWPSDREQADMIGAIAFISTWLEQQGRPRDVILFGVSRGAGASILAAEGIQNVRAIIGDGVYSSDLTLEYFMKRFATIFARIRVVAENHPPVFWRFLRWLLFRECVRKFGCKFPSVRKTLARLDAVPVLMIHGERDSYIPVSLAEALYVQAAGPKRLWIVPGAKHNEAIMVHSVAYARHILTFLAEHLGTSRAAALRACEVRTLEPANADMPMAYPAPTPVHVTSTT